MKDDIRKLIKKLKTGIEILKKEEKSEFIDGQIEMAQCVITELQKMVLGLK